MNLYKRIVLLQDELKREREKYARLLDDRNKIHTWLRDALDAKAKQWKSFTEESPPGTSPEELAARMVSPVDPMSQIARQETTPMEHDRPPLQHTEDPTLTGHPDFPEPGGCHTDSFLGKATQYGKMPPEEVTDNGTAPPMNIPPPPPPSDMGGPPHDPPPLGRPDRPPPTIQHPTRPAHGPTA